MGRYAAGYILFLCILGNLTFADTADSLMLRVSQIAVFGNQRTRLAVIEREFTLMEGGVYTLEILKARIAETRNNLQRLPLFNFVDIQTTVLPDASVQVDVHVTERWYIWLWPVFELADRNFNAWLQKGDITRVSYGLFFQHENFTGRLEKLHIRAKAGYQQELSLLYENPYLNHAKTLGAGLILSGGRERELGYKTYGNALLFYRAENPLQEQMQASIYMRYRRQMHISHMAEVSYNYYRFSDSLLLLNPEYPGVEGHSGSYVKLSYMFKADFRDQRAYPLTGWYADAGIDQTGWPFRSPMHFLSFRASARLHLQLAKRWYFAAGCAVLLSENNAKPYYLNKALGYHRDYIRGYEYKVIDGNHFLLAKANVKYALVPQRVKQIGFLTSEKFSKIPYAVYFGLYADAGEAWPATDKSLNSLQQQLLAGVGAGFDLVTYYDKVMRIEFSVNRHGSAGFFIHFMAAI